MKVDPLEFDIGVTSVKVRMADCEVGTTQDGDIDIQATAINVDVQDEVHQVLDEPTDWSEDAIKEVVRNAWLEGKEYWPDTSDKSWTSTRLVSQDSKEYSILNIIVEEGPVTGSRIAELYDGENGVGNQVYRLKKKNLIAAISKAGHEDVLVPTHIGHKEYSIHHDVVSSLID